MDLNGYINRQRRWSTRVFGPGDRLDGVLDHMRKEMVEVREAAPEDRLSEWVDLIILAIDGAQSRNMSRVWPDWTQAEPGKAIEHVHGSSPEDEPRSWSEEIRS